MLPNVVGMAGAFKSNGLFLAEKYYLPMCGVKCFEISCSGNKSL